MATRLDDRTQSETRLRLYRTMQVIRKCEEELARCHQRGLVHGACHTYVGQEAIAAGVCGHLRTDDAVFSTHRGHGHALAKGLEPRQLIAELFGRSTGCSRGRGGSMHLFAPEIGLMGTSGIVGPSILQAAGAGYGFKILKCDRVAVAFFGDGAVNNGAFHEGLNMAAIWNLPVLFVPRRKQPVRDRGSVQLFQREPQRGRASRRLRARGGRTRRERCVGHLRRGRRSRFASPLRPGATLLECKTYRTRPHAEGMGDFGYRTREEVDGWKGRCPIARLRKVLCDDGLADASQLAAIDAEIAELIAEAVHFAEASPWPEAATAAQHVYSGAEPAPDHERSNPEGQTNGTPRVVNWMQATLESLSSAMQTDSKIFVMGEGIGKRGGNFKSTLGLYDRFGADRLCDTPICERGFVGLGGGAAMVGARPVIDFMFADFILDSIGEILNQIAKMQYMSSGRLKMPILLRGCVGIGHSAATHHSGNYYPMYAHFPGLRVVLPSTPADAKGLLLHALRSDDPVMFLEHRELLSLKGPVPEGDYEIPFGRAAVLRPGTDVTVVAMALMAQHALKAAETLAGEGASVEVVDPRTISPLDVETVLTSVAKTGRLLIVDEAFQPFGVGAEIAAQIADRGFDELDAPIRRLNGVHTPTPYSPPLEAAVVPGVAAILSAIRELLDE